MAKTSNLQIQKQPTRKQMSRAEREAASSRRVWLGVGGILVLAILVIVYGYLRQTVFILNEPVANVNGEAITTRQFQNRVRLAEKQVQQQILVAQSLGDQQSYNYYLNQLQDPTALGDQMINSMVDDLLLKQSAASFNVSIADAEVEQYIQKQLRYDPNPPTPAPTSTPRPTPSVNGPITQTATPSNTPFPTATPVTFAGYKQLYQDRLGQLAELGMGEQEYRDLIKTSLLVDKIRTAIAATVVTTTDQIKFQYIQVPTAAVLTVTQSVNERGFAAIYQAVLSETYPITSVHASETVDWVPMEEISSTASLGPVVAKEFFATPVSQTVSVINATGTDTFIAFIQDHQLQPLSASFLQSRQQAAVEDWLAARRKAEFILTWNDRVPVMAVPTLPPQANGSGGPSSP
jgi:hypothetical protein